MRTPSRPYAARTASCPKNHSWALDPIASTSSPVETTSSNMATSPDAFLAKNVRKASATECELVMKLLPIGLWSLAG